MGDVFLIGNKINEYALTRANAVMNHDMIMNFVSAIREHMAVNGQLLPVEYNNLEDFHNYWPSGLSDEVGEIYLACFNSEEELHKGKSTAGVSQYIDVFLDAATDSNSVKGVIINPFGITFRLPKGVI